MIPDTSFIVELIENEDIIFNKDSEYHKQKKKEKKNPNGKQLIKIDYKRLSERQCERFAFMLKQKRIDNKLSREALSKKLGYSQSLIKKWECLEVHPNLYNVEDVATYFDLPVNVLIGEE